MGVGGLLGDGGMGSMAVSSLVGRADELAMLDRALQRAESGQGQAVFIEGEGGIGKTCLIDEVLAEARRKGLDGCRRPAAGDLRYIPRMPENRDSG